MALNGPHAAGQFSQHGGLIAGAGADLQHPRVRGEAEKIGHAGHHVRLGDGLAQSDGEWAVVIGRPALGGGHEQMAGDLLHGCQHPLVDEAATTELVLDHAVTEVGEVGVVEFGAHGCESDPAGSP